MKDAYVAALIEDMNSKFELIVEALDFMRADIKSIKKTLAEVVADCREHHAWLNDHEIRITALET